MMKVNDRVNLAKCEMIKAMNEFLGWEADDIAWETWLIIGPPDGAVSDYERADDKRQTELWDWVQDTECLDDWIKAFNKIYEYIKRECR